MKKVIKNYKSTFILILAIILGGLVGFILKEDAKVLSPFGDIFINLLLVVIVPLIFLTITTSIAKMSSPKRLGKIMLTTIGAFVVTSLIAVIVGFVYTYGIKLVETDDTWKITSTLSNEEVISEEVNVLERTVDTLTVKSFNELLTTDHLIALLVFSILFGLALNKSGEKGKSIKRVLESLNEVVMKLTQIIMYYAPIGLGCYFAVLVGTLGSEIAIGYLKTFVIYTIVAILYYFVIYTIYAYIAGKKEGVKRFWKNVIPATATALATCSSAASIPINCTSAKKIGVSDDIADTVIPLGTSFHKDGSIIGSVFKIMFLVCLFGTDISGFGGMTKILMVALVATLLVTAVPIGGGTISEMMIITMMGYSASALPILTIIATIIDAPATVLNVVGDLSTSMVVARVVDGKNFLEKKANT
ncbi:MAG: dicarboxylate/amino acid:cation symporter [Bacilli bacterium]